MNKYSTRAAPFDATVLDEFADWRDAVHWPVAVADIQHFQRAWMREFAKVISEAASDDAELLLLAFPFIITQCTVFAETGLALTGARARNVDLIGGPAQLSALRQGAMAGTPAVPGRPTPQRALAKRLLLPVTWSSLVALPRALLRPSAWAVSRNPLLKQEARHATDAIGYLDPGVLLCDMRRPAASAALGQRASELARMLMARMLFLCALDADIHARCLAAAEFAATQILLHLWQDREAVRLLKLPTAIWGGTGGQYHVRLLALEILRRGGTVSLFDHGGTAAMRSDEDATALAIRELAPATHYILPTEALVKASETAGAVEWAGQFGFAGLRGGHGETHMLKLALSRKAPAKTPPRVLYPSSLIRGFRSTGVIPMPDIVYLDWQVRLAENLAAMPIELICKPHPEGVFSGRRHPVADVAPVRTVPFEELIEWTDVFVFDRCSTTTFWEAVCTDRPIVYIDCGVFQFGRRIGAMIARRCHVLKAAYDDRNRPIIDLSELEDAVLFPRGGADPTELQKLLIGHAA